MSAFVVSKTHIDILVAVGRYGPSDRGPKYAGDGWHTLRWYTENPRNVPIRQAQSITRQLDHTTMDRTGQMLLDTNVASVRHRYPDDPDNLPGPLAQYWQAPYTYSDPVIRPTAVEALAAINCYEYQACEHPEWDGSEAESFCERLRRSLIHALPGIDDAPWEWTLDEIAKRRGLSVVRNGKGKR